MEAYETNCNQAASKFKLAAELNSFAFQVSGAGTAGAGGFKSG